MADNLVSQPPLTVAISDSNGMLNKSWAIWFRDLYRRTAYKGGNAIDANKEVTDAELLAINASLEETILQVNENIEGITTNTNNLVEHESLESAHGSNGDIVGFNDLATDLLFGLVKQMLLVTDANESNVNIDSPNATVSTVNVVSPNAIVSTVSVASPDVALAPAAYNQTFTDTIVTMVNELKGDVNQLVSDVNPSATLSNEIKGDVNQLVADINASIVQLNELLTNSKASDQMSST